MPLHNPPQADEPELAPEPVLVSASQDENTRAESALNVRKFLSLLWLRLGQQGVQPTLLWLMNLALRMLFGRPLRRLCQVSPHLYVGGQYGKGSWRALQAWGVTAVVNLRAEYDDGRAGIAPPHYLYLPTTDDTPPRLEDLARGVEFIRQEVTQGGAVYIHCGAGVGRAPTMAVAYLVSTGMTPVEAWQAVRRARPFIRPTVGQVERIVEFAQARPDGKVKEKSDKPPGFVL